MPFCAECGQTVDWDSICKQCGSAMGPASSGGVVSADKQWEQAQIAAYTSWINMLLKPRGLAIQDVGKDWTTGLLLIHLLEVLTEQKFPSKIIEKPTMRIQSIQNLSLALKWNNELHPEIKTSVSAENFADSNLTLILGYLFALYKKYQINNISVGGKTSEAGLLAWVQEMTKGYKHVNVENFKSGFKNGMAFLALVDKYVLSDKSVLDYDSQNPEKAVENLKLAFDLATKKMNVPKILSATDVAAGNVDDRSMVLALSMYYHAFQQEEKRQELENQRRMLEENERRAKEQADRAKEQADRAKEEADEANKNANEAQKQAAALALENERMQQELENLRKQLEEQELKSREKVKPADVWESFQSNPVADKAPRLSIPFSLEVPDGKKTYTVYHIKVEMQQKIWIVKRRYREFDKFHDSVKKHWAKKPQVWKNFPGKKVIGNLKSEFVTERKKGLELFLKDLATDPEVISSDLVGDFIAKDSILTLIDEKSFKQQQLNKYQQQQQEEQLIPPKK